MNIGIDLDDTINTLAPTLIKYAREYNRINNILHDIKTYEWDFDKAFGWDDNNIEEFLDKYIIRVFSEAKLKSGTREVIEKLKEQGHNIIIITARHEKHVKDIYDISKNWLENYKISYDKLVINSDDKAEKCKENEIDIFIDDNIKHCERVYQSLKIPVYIFDSEYNKRYISDKIKRVSSWEEFYHEIKNIKK